MEIRVRYAPSPTGKQHIGSMRTALFDYLIARSLGGKFILRLEDTDRTRYADEYVQNVYDTFSWLGFSWDEGPDVGGPYGPYVQSERLPFYQKSIAELLEKGQAYYCFCGAERLEGLRTAQAESKSGEQGYDRHCRSIDHVEAAARVAGGEKAVVRLKIPLEGTTKFNDILLGEIEWKNSDVNPDPILLKSDGFPTYHIANVVDDHFMRISLVTRAQEWIPSAPLHAIMYRAFGWEMPKLCHLPMVNGQDGHKLSKRHGATSVDEFREGGYLREALINYVGMLGESYEEGRELYSLDDMEKSFKMDRLNKAPAVFDYKKLEWFNGQYIRLKTDEELAALLLPFAVKGGLFGGAGKEPDAGQRDLLLRAVPLVKERLSILNQVTDSLRFLFEEPAPPLPEDLIPKKLDAAMTKIALEAVELMVGELVAASEEKIEELVRAKAEALSIKLGDLLMPVRVAITGSRVSPPLFGCMKLLGVENSIIRIRNAKAVL